MEPVPSGFAPLQGQTPAPIPDAPAFIPLIPEKVRYASFSKRLFAYLLDNLLIAAFITFVTAATLGDAMTLLEDYDKLFFVAEMIYGLHSFAFIGYFTITTGSSGMTAGKYLMGVRVACDNGGQLGYSRAFVRSLSYFVSGFFLYIGFLLALFSKKKQALHDMISGTVVLEND
ncbi:MAG: RDD family protein [Nitrospinae bacterium]|nr:RDD family protein [Nitrospinota bacterium]